MRNGLIAGVVVLIVLMIFIIQNTHAVNISFLGADLHLSLAVALLLAAVAGAVLLLVSHLLTGQSGRSRRFAHR
jgi:lipopolysaccharide assembly protein A